MRRLTVYIYTYGVAYFTPEESLLNRTVYAINCTRLRPPPPHLCDGHTGLEPETADAFWSHRSNQDRYDAAMLDIKEILLDIRGTVSFAAIGVFCQAGMHRSAAMAERVSRHIRQRWPWAKANHPQHLTMLMGLERHRDREYGRRFLEYRSQERAWL